MTRLIAIGWIRLVGASSDACADSSARRDGPITQVAAACSPGRTQVGGRVRGKQSTPSAKEQYALFSKYRTRRSILLTMQKLTRAN